MKRWLRLGAAAATLTAASTAMAQLPQPPVHTAPAHPAVAKEADGASVDSTVAALYEVISGPAGAPRNWNRMRALFAPDAKLMVIQPGRDGGYGLRTMTVEDYISRNMSAFNTSGFYEREIARTTDAFGQLVHVFSTYELLRSPNDPKPFMRGINSIQLAFDGKRWWIANLVWRAEDAGLALPERYLQSR
ncbi:MULTISPECIES: hypothetical protein [unclassified Massilia]|uniref:hypothetical protein n=1 Tax=unclassified Massilia TaxID=2609279 RepID=UPI001E5B4A3D|nr:MULTISPECIES: hypothetical protein [unclassified Massilia]